MNDGFGQNDVFLCVIQNKNSGFCLDKPTKNAKIKYRIYFIGKFIINSNESALIESIDNFNFSIVANGFYKHHHDCPKVAIFF